MLTVHELGRPREMRRLIVPVDPGLLFRSVVGRGSRSHDDATRFTPADADQAGVTTVLITTSSVGGHAARALEKRRRDAWSECGRRRSSSSQAGATPARTRSAPE
jgi:hypothetical protein